MKWPEMQVDLIEGRFLKMLVRLTSARTVLELGMFTGYSALMMAEALPDDGCLITCEIDPKAEAIARRYFAESPHGHKITIRMGPALDTIKTLTDPLDLIFIDADKANYSNYYEACLPLLKPGGLIVGDNVLWSGKVVDPKDADAHAIDAFDRLVQSDHRDDDRNVPFQQITDLVEKLRAQNVAFEELIIPTKFTTCSAGAIGSVPTAPPPNSSTA